MNRSYLSRIESGAQAASSNFISKVCRTFDIPLEYFDEKESFCEIELDSNVSNMAASRHRNIIRQHEKIYINSAHKILDELFEYKGIDDKEFQKKMNALLGNIKNYLLSKDTSQNEDGEEMNSLSQEWVQEIYEAILDL
jgi:transcriptional regulator with XRE-family HTH domain